MVPYGTSRTYWCCACVLIVRFVELVLSNQKLKNMLKNGQVSSVQSITEEYAFDNAEEWSSFLRLAFNTK